MRMSNKILVIDIHRNFEKKNLWLNHDKYVYCILDKSNKVNSKRVCTSLTSHFKLFIAQCSIDAHEKKECHVFFINMLVASCI